MLWKKFLKCQWPYCLSVQVPCWISASLKQSLGCHGNIYQKGKTGKVLISIHCWNTVNVNCTSYSLIWHCFLGCWKKFASLIVCAPKFTAYVTRNWSTICHPAPSWRNLTYCAGEQNTFLLVLLIISGPASACFENKTLCGLKGLESVFFLTSWPIHHLWCFFFSSISILTCLLALDCEGHGIDSAALVMPL